MTVDEILSEVVRIIQDGAYSDIEAPDILDIVVQDVGSLVRIPSAKKVGSLTISATETSTNVQTVIPNFAPLYCDKVWNATTSTFVKVYTSLELLFADYPSFTEEGDIEAIAFEDFMLWSQKVATVDQDLSLIYYDMPSVPSVNNSVAWLPAGFHYNILVCGCVARAFGELEDGFEAIDGDGKPNTGFYASRYFKGLKDYKNYMARSATHRMSNFWSA